MPNQFDITKATEEQKRAIDAVTELSKELAVQWCAGPFGSAYTELHDSRGNPCFYVVSRDGSFMTKEGNKKVA